MHLNGHAQQKLLGHTGRCFDIRYSSDGDFLLSASEDGTAILWDVKTRKPNTTFKHNKESEVLRAAYLNTKSTLITTCGADGQAIIWEISEDRSLMPEDSYNILDVPSTESKISSSNISSNIHRGKKRLKKQAMLSHEAAQIYACESLDSDSSTSTMFMTAADSSVYLWDINASLSAKLSSTPSHKWTVNSNFSNGLSPTNMTSDETGFGGPRNPDNQIYIFDAKINPRNCNNVALALSDGNIQQIDIRIPTLVSLNKTTPSFSSSSSPSSSFLTNNSMNKNVTDSNSCNNLSSISLAGLDTTQIKKAIVGNSHATSVSFSDDGLSLLAALGSGDVAVVDLRMGIVRTLLHSHTRTCFGSAFYPLRNSGNIQDNVRNSKDDYEMKNEVKMEKSNENGNDIDSSDKIENDLNLTSSSLSSSSRCISWSNDCTIRSWDISVDGLCTEPIDIIVMPDFPIFSCTLKGVSNGIEFACGGGSGEASFIGTPLHLFYNTV